MSWVICLDLRQNALSNRPVIPGFLRYTPNASSPTQPQCSTRGMRHTSKGRRTRVARGACSKHQRESAPAERSKLKLGCSPQLLYTLDMSAAAAAKKTSVELGCSGTSASAVDFRMTPLVSGRGTPVMMLFCTDEMLDCQAVECAKQQSERAMYGSTQLVPRSKPALF